MEEEVRLALHILILIPMHITRGLGNAWWCLERCGLGTAAPGHLVYRD